MRATDGALLIISLMIAWSFYRAHRNRDFRFNVFDLIMENDKVSKTACVFMGSFVVMSWVLIRATLDGKLDTTLFAAYGAVWAAPIISRFMAAPK